MPKIGLDLDAGHGAGIVYDWGGAAGGKVTHASRRIQVMANYIMEAAKPGGYQHTIVSAAKPGGMVRFLFSEGVLTYEIISIDDSYAVLEWPE